MNIHLLIIDPQVDFCSPVGKLPVEGADKDCIRLATMIKRLESEIDQIHVTLDSHNEYDIAHPVFWRDMEGNRPKFYTTITSEDLKKFQYTTTKLDNLDWAIKYVEKLEISNRYPLCIWPPHCITGTYGWSVEDNVSNALRRWSKSQLKSVNFVTKGENPLTEHYSAIKAEVPDPLDKKTWVNNDMLNNLACADIVLVAGQALSHCVSNTISDVIDELGKEFSSKVVLVRDTCSNVPGFECLGEKFIEDKMKIGMRVTDSVNVLKSIKV